MILAIIDPRAPTDKNTRLAVANLRHVNAPTYDSGQNNLEGTKMEMSK